MNMPGEEARRAALFRPLLQYRGASQEDARKFAREGLLRVATGEELSRIVTQTLASADPYAVTLVAASLAYNGVRTDEAIELLLAAYMRRKSDQLPFIHIAFLRPTPTLLSYLAQVMEHADDEHFVGLLGPIVRLGRYDSPALDRVLLERLLKLGLEKSFAGDVAYTTTGIETLTTVLAEQPLAADSLRRVQEVYRQASPANALFLRDLLYRRGRGVIELDSSVLTDVKIQYVCTFTEVTTGCESRSYTK